MKTRIIEYKEFGGKSQFKPQRQFMWIWFDMCSDGYSDFNTINDARKYIINYKELKNSKEVIHNE